jgi:hypothetical protein
MVFHEALVGLSVFGQWPLAVEQAVSFFGYGCHPLRCLSSYLADDHRAKSTEHFGLSGKYL